ncbi:MAG: helix-turn-helix domain-containing protein [Tagaea sp.]
MAAIQPEIGREAGSGTAETPLRARVGEILRAERERRGWSVGDVAEHLKIRRVQLEAIESGDFSELPRGAYAPGFVRSYAELLDLDAAELSRRFKEEAAGIDTPVELTFPTPINESRLPGRVLVALSLLLAVGAYGTWYYVTAADRAPVPRVTAVPETLAARVPPPSASEAQARPSMPQPTAPAPQAVPAPAPSSAPAPVAQMAPPAAPQMAAVPQPAAPVPTPAIVPPPAAPVVVAAPTPSADPSAPRVFGEASEGRIVIRATGDSWTQVRDASGAIIFSRILRAGESYNVPNRPGLVLSTGNAGALDVRVDGSAAPAIGRPGMVERAIVLDPERLAAGAARIDAPPPAAARAPGSQG